MTTCFERSTPLRSTSPNDDRRIIRHRQRAGFPGRHFDGLYSVVCDARKGRFGFASLDLALNDAKQLTADGLAVRCQINGGKSYLVALYNGELVEVRVHGRM